MLCTPYHSVTTTSPHTTTPHHTTILPHTPPHLPTPLHLTTPPHLTPLHFTTPPHLIPLHLTTPLHRPTPLHHHTATLSRLTTTIHYTTLLLYYIPLHHTTTPPYTTPPHHHTTTTPYTTTPNHQTTTPHYNTSLHHSSRPPHHYTTPPQPNLAGPTLVWEEMHPMHCDPCQMPPYCHIQLFLFPLFYPVNPLKCFCVYNDIYVRLLKVIEKALAGVLRKTFLLWVLSIMTAIFRLTRFRLHENCAAHFFHSKEVTGLFRRS